MELREGFTTGTAATAATYAALNYLLGREKIELATIFLPPNFIKSLEIKILEVNKISDNEAYAIVVKDAGDDPDVTDKAKIKATVKLNNLKNNTEAKVKILGGEGVGIVSLPGLGIDVGQAAINPVPRKQITYAIDYLCEKFAFEDIVQTTISVENGAEIAKKTLNPKLGILGGISILGTQGTVKPYSNKAWQDTIIQELKLNKAINNKTIVLCTGRRSEQFFAKLNPTVNEQAYIQVADFMGFGVCEAVKHEFEHIEISCFFGKLLKLAQKNAYTHAHTNELNLEDFAKICESFGVEDKITRQISATKTANHALEILNLNIKKDLKEKIIYCVAKYAHNFVKSLIDDDKNIKINFNLFDLDGNLILRYENK